MPDPARPQMAWAATLEKQGYGCCGQAGTGKGASRISLLGFAVHGDIGLVFGIMSGRLQHDDGHQHDDRAFCQSYASVLPKIGHPHNSN